MRPGYFARLRCAELAVSATRDTPILHKLALKGDLDYTVEFFMNTCVPEKSNLVFVIGFDPARQRFLGARATASSSSRGTGRS